MTRNEMHKIMRGVYDLDVKMDEVIRHRDMALERKDQRQADICTTQYDRFAYQWTGMELVLDALGYHLVDNEGNWCLERKC